MLSSNKILNLLFPCQQVILKMMSHKISALSLKIYLKLATTQARLHRPLLPPSKWNLANGLSSNIWQPAAQDSNLHPPNSPALHHNTLTCQHYTHRTRSKSFTRQHLPCRRLRTLRCTLNTRPRLRRHPAHHHRAPKTCVPPAQCPQTLESPCQHHAARVTNARTVLSPTPRTPGSRSTNNTTVRRLKAALPASRLAASTALKCTRLLARSRCTSVPTPCRASVTCAAKLSRGRGCCRDISVRTLVRNRFLAIIAGAHSPIDRICALIFKLIRTLRSTRALAAARHSPGCHC